MGLRKLVKGLTTTTGDLERQRLSTRFFVGAHDQVALSSCPLRTSVRVVGEVTGQRVTPRAGSPSLEVVVSDGTGEAVAVFTGRRRLRGLDPGRAVVLTGVARDERGRLTLVNPAYTLLV